MTGGSGTSSNSTPSNSGGGSEAGLDASETYDLTDALAGITPSRGAARLAAPRLPPP
jgi:hypothetical protein